MHIMHMLGALSAVFFVSLFLMCYFRDKLKNPIIEPLIIIADAVFFFSWNLAKYEHSGLTGGFMTLDNISPFIATIMLVIPFVSKKVKEFIYPAIAFLSFGMFVALYISPGNEYIVNYHQQALPIHVSEAACHLIMAIYGFYLILSGKVKHNSKSYAKALIFIYSVIGYGIFLNYFFHKSFFGMDMHGNYSIYFMDLFGSFEATLIAYLLGVLFTLTSGYLVSIFIDWVSSPEKKKQKDEALVAEAADVGAEIVEGSSSEAVEPHSDEAESGADEAEEKVDESEAVAEEAVVIEK